MIWYQVNVFKDPVTDSGKKSKRGRLRLVRGDGNKFHTEEEVAIDSTEEVSLRVLPFDSFHILLNPQSTGRRGSVERVLPYNSKVVGSTPTHATA